MTQATKRHREAARALDIGDQPLWPTTLRGRLRDGRLQGIDGSVWLYRGIPMSPVADARDSADLDEAAQPMMKAFHELSKLVNAPIKRRRLASSSYRDVHMLLVNVPRLYQPDRNDPLAEYLRQAYPSVITPRRVALFGVRLHDKIGGGGGLLDAVDSVVETIVSGTTPLSDYDADFAEIETCLDRSGMLVASPDDIRLANAWWNHGRSADTPTVRHADHLHFFTDVDSLRLAEAEGLKSCANWSDIPGQHAITFASMAELDLPIGEDITIDSTDPTAQWVCDLIDADALAVSIRARIEPAAITREELKSNRKSVRDDINERHNQGKLSDAEQEERLQTISGVEAVYARGEGTATLAGASVLAAFDGQVNDVNRRVYSQSPADLTPMSWRQSGAHTEMMLCSPYRANPNLLDLPSQSVAYSGFSSLSVVGDHDGATIGFTELDNQPVKLSPKAAASGDDLPICLVCGATGSGKTQFGLFVADEFTRMKVPGIFIDPKMTSDHSDVVKTIPNHQISSLDSLVDSDGVFDPIRFSRSPDVAADLATNMLLQINPFGGKRADYEVPLQKAIYYGVNRGATCVGEALKIADRDLDLPVELVSRVFDLTESSPLARACIGVEPGGSPLSVHEGLTLIKVGDANLAIEGLEKMTPEQMTVTQRVTLALVRMMVYGSAMALAGLGGGVLYLDEAWTFLSAGRADIDRLGRIARSQDVLPIFFTQKVSDALNAGLEGFISRGFILHIKDPDEARAACRVFNMEATEERMKRITSKATIGSHGGGTKPNWDSLKALRDETGDVVRGAVAYYCDLAGRAVPLEIALPQGFLDKSSTTPEEVRRRQQEAAARTAA
ncbi:ATP-binding protein [Aeromicrobium sp. CTD01-1L150]|uniref:ATP-binding protein n=1 Tax=Aeromicrobium sp. CTD01-1L150 TaxID=3341830 RepID=UPI0035C05BC0